MAPILYFIMPIQENIMHSLRPRKGFTLIEIMVVVITLGVIMSLALTSYKKVLEQNYCRNAQQNMVLIYNAVQVFKIKKNPASFPASPNLAAINAALGISIPDDPKFTYDMPAGSNLGPWDISVNRVDGSYTCYMQFWEVISPLSSTNPACTAGMELACPSIISD
jgi:prepilin-type N-terminal cleavage/methylation domain-containing protein